MIHVNCLTVDRRSEGYADCVPQAADYPVMDCELKMAVAVSFVLKTLNYKLKADIPADQGSTDHLVAVCPGLMEGWIRTVSLLAYKVYTNVYKNLKFLSSESATRVP